MRVLRIRRIGNFGHGLRHLAAERVESNKSRAREHCSSYPLQGRFQLLQTPCDLLRLAKLLCQGEYSLLGTTCGGFDANVRDL